MMCNEVFGYRMSVEGHNLMECNIGILGVVMGLKLYGSSNMIKWWQVKWYETYYSRIWSM